MSSDHKEKDIAQQVATLTARVEELEAEREKLAHEFIRGTDDEGRVQRMLVSQSDELLQAHEQLKQNQAQIVHSEKMAGLGQLAAGIAHEINNPIGFLTSNLNTLNDYCGVFERVLRAYGEMATAIEGSNLEELKRLQGEVQALKESEELDYIIDDVKDLLSESLDGASRVRDIVVNLRNFARLDESDLKETNINECIEQTLRVVWNELKYKCEIVQELRDLPPIACYPGQLNQVFMNLLINAAQAITERGVIHIQTQVEGALIVIRVSDTGEGIERENLSKLFDPFFTTKSVGQGTGLGLSIVHGIVENHHGTINVESEVGKGTTFTIRIPVEGLKHA